MTTPTSKYVDCLSDTPSLVSLELLLLALMLVLVVLRSVVDEEAEEEEYASAVLAKGASKYILYPCPRVRTKRSRKYTHPPYAVALSVPLNFPPGGLRCTSASSDGCALSLFTVDQPVSSSAAVEEAERRNDPRASLQFFDFGQNKRRRIRYARAREGGLRVNVAGGRVSGNTNCAHFSLATQQCWSVLCSSGFLYAVLWFRVPVGSSIIIAQLSILPISRPLRASETNATCTPR